VLRYPGSGERRSGHEDIAVQDFPRAFDETARSGTSEIQEKESREVHATISMLTLVTVREGRNAQRRESIHSSDHSRIRVVDGAISKHSGAHSKTFTSLLPHHHSNHNSNLYTPRRRSPFTNQVGATGRGGPLGWRQSGKVVVAAIQRSWVQFPARPERQKEMIKGQSKEKRQSRKVKEKKKAEKPS
jgi:hypothetical protein